MMSHRFPCNADTDKATNKKHTSNERKFYIFYEKIPKLDDRGFRASKVDILQFGNFLRFFFDKFRKNGKYLHFPM